MALTRQEVRHIIDRSISRAVRSDSRYAQIRQGVASVTRSAMDSKFDSMSVREFSEHWLRKLGIVGNGDSMPDDPTTALMAWLTGRQEGLDAARGIVPKHAQDAQESDFIGRYLAGA